MSAFDMSPLLSTTEPGNLWRPEATEGVDVDHFLDHQRNEKQYDAKTEANALASEHDTSEPARTARRYLVARAALGEVCGTFLLIFVACGTPIATHSLSTSSTTATSPLMLLLLNNLCVALIVIGLIYSLASVSGAHVNPAVTLALWTSHHTSARKLILFILSQLLGAVLALLALVVCYNGDWTVLAHSTVTRTEQASMYSVFLMELILTAILIFIMLRTSFDNIEAEKRQMHEYRNLIGSAVGLTVAPSTNARLGYAPVAVGLTVLVLGVMGGGVSGAAMNPVRYTVPAVMSGEVDVWIVIYVLAQCCGACLAVGLAQVFDSTGRVAERWAERAANLRKMKADRISVLIGGVGSSDNGKGVAARTIEENNV